MIKYTQDHEWISVEAQDPSVAIIGITQHASELLGDVVFVDLPIVGAMFAKSDSLAVVESVKAASDVYCPVSGEVLAVNEDLSSNPETVNADANSTWFVKILMKDDAEFHGSNTLMTLEEYQEFIS